MELSKTTKNLKPK